MPNNKFETLVIDVDGVLTDGKFYYNKKGKFAKVFGPDDHDALKFIKDDLKILFVTADKKGFDISKKRIVLDMGFDLFLVDTKNRKDWISNQFDMSKVIYIGDGIYDHLVMKEVGYSIATKDSLVHTQNAANFVTSRSGGDRCLAEAIIHIASNFFGKTI